MVNYLLATEEQRELAELARDIAEKELRPGWKNWKRRMADWVRIHGRYIRNLPRPDFIR